MFICVNIYICVCVSVWRECVHICSHMHMPFVVCTSLCVYVCLCMSLHVHMFGMHMCLCDSREYPCEGVCGRGS